MFGSEYDAKSVWTTSKWTEHVPPGLFLHEARSRISQALAGEDGGSSAGGSSSDVPLPVTRGFFDARSAPKRKLVSKAAAATASSRFESESESGASDEESAASEPDPTEAALMDLDLRDPEAQRALLQAYTPQWLAQESYMKAVQDEWVMGVTCHHRTSLYHALLHYKLRLLMSVRAQLLRVSGDMKRFLASSSFFAGELRRYQKLLRRAKRWNLTGHGGGWDEVGADDLWEGGNGNGGSEEDDEDEKGQEKVGAEPIDESLRPDNWGDLTKSQKKRWKKTQRRAQRKARVQTTITDAFDPVESCPGTKNSGAGTRDIAMYELDDDIIDDSPSSSQARPYLVQSQLNFVNSASSSSSTGAGGTPGARTGSDWSHSRNSRVILSAMKGKK
jgi:hypothetical protein